MVSFSQSSFFQIALACFKLTYNLPAGKVATGGAGSLDVAMDLNPLTVSFFLSFFNFVNVYMCVHACIHVCAYRGQHTLGIFLNLFLPYSLETRSLPEPGAQWLGWLVIKLGSTCPHPSTRVSGGVTKLLSWPLEL